MNTKQIISIRTEFAWRHPVGCYFSLDPGVMHLQIKANIQRFERLHKEAVCFYLQGWIHHWLANIAIGKETHEHSKYYVMETTNKTKKNISCVAFFCFNYQREALDSLKAGKLEQTYIRSFAMQIFHLSSHLSRNTVFKTSQITALITRIFVRRFN